MKGIVSSDVVACDNARHSRSPDASFSCNEAQFPSLIMEAACSQGATSLRHVANDLVMMNNGNVKMVIGLKIDYARKPRKVADKVLL